MIDLTVPDINGQQGMALWDEPCIPPLTPSGIALPPAGGKRKKRKVKVKNAEFLTMTKLFFQKNRKVMFDYLNDPDNNWYLHYRIGFSFEPQVFSCLNTSFDNPSFWKITRTMFEADVTFTVNLHTEAGLKQWRGCFIFSFTICDTGINGYIEDCINCSEMPNDPDREKLSAYLIPIHRGWMMDCAGEGIWKHYYNGVVPPEAERNAPELARRMGFTIRYQPVHNSNGVGSILFFREGKLLVKDKKLPSDVQPETKIIPANTIVINTNVVKKEYSWFDIYHECYHYEMHYAFYVLQQLGCNDLRDMEDMVIEVDENDTVNNPIYWIETQANRGAYAPMMPVTEMRALIRQELAKVVNPIHEGDRYQQVGLRLGDILHKPHFRIRARLIQLGHIHARGALNYVEGELIPPFDFDDDSWTQDDCTFVIDPLHSGKIYEKNKDYRALLDTGKYVYAQGHIVINSPGYVIQEENRHVLTAWANRNIDQCCLRFKREYKLKNIGRYVPGRMNYDADYAMQMEFYLSDIMNEKQLEADQAKLEYIKEFPDTFRDAFNQLARKNHMSQEECAELWHIPLTTLKRWLANPEEFISVDFIIFLTLTWKLTDFITDLLFELVSKRLNVKDQRQSLLSYILRVEWADGVENANKRLKARGFDPLTF